MLVTLLGIVTLVRLVQPENAPSPMLVTLLGIVKLSGFAPRILDERGLALVEQDPINTAIGGVERLHR